MIEQMGRRPMSCLVERFGELTRLPVPGPIRRRILLVNGWSASAAELLATFFKRSDLGPVLGTRTFGALSYWLFGPYFIDRGWPSLATTAHRAPDGEDPFDIEGKGFEPCIVELERLDQLARGCDHQLETAIDHLLRSM
jgi:tricorn protease